MGPLSRWAVFNPWKAVAIWVVAMIAIFVGAGALGANYNESFTLPNTESKQAQDILEAKFGSAGASNEDATVKIVFSPATGTVQDAAVKKEVADLLAEVKAIPTVESVTSPFDAPKGGASGGSAATDGTAGSFSQPISPDNKVGYATVVFKVNEDGVPETKPVTTLVDTLEAANTPALQVGGAGSLLDYAGQEPPSSEGIGIAVALVILLLMFGSLLAAVVPIVSALIGLSTGLMTVTIFTHVFDMPSFATVLATMIGLGVGIDYSLFVINRFKAAIDAGRDKRQAATEAVNTAGRAVLFAGTTVIIALAGLFVLGISFMNGLAIAAMFVVLCVMLGALWLLPAVLSLLGTKSFALKLPWRRQVKHHPKGTAMARYGNWLQGKPWLGLVAIGIVILIALPTFALRSGFADNGGSPEGSVKRIGYDLLSEGFGPGINGPFIVVAELPKAGDFSGADAVAKAIQDNPNVAGATGAVGNDFTDPSKSTAAIITVYPKSSPQATETDALLKTLRNDVIPNATEGTGTQAYVGGAKAIVNDFGKVLTDALPLFLLVVIGLGFLALTVLFRSLVVPLTAAVTSLLSFAAGLGITVMVFQWGWMASVFGVEATGPIVPFLPIMLFAILFGLSMDYQVFLVSRMQEEWAHTGDNRRSVRRGLAGSGRVVAAAGAIMASVFFAFVLGDDPTAKLFGLALATAVLVDAFLVRLVVVPAFMTVLGTVNWWLPGWLDKLLPHFQVESDEDFAAEEELIEDVPDEDLEKSSTH
jgi:RND superfamily putative drug exporter